MIGGVYTPSDCSQKRYISKLILSFILSFFFLQQTHFFSTKKLEISSTMAAYESLEFEQLKTSPLGQCIGTANQHLNQMHRN